MIYETYFFSNHFMIGGLRISPVHLRLEALRPDISAHQHSINSFEIHYSEKGTGNVVVDGKTFDVTADTLYVTGPQVIHEQNCDENDPVLEYCLYMDCEIADASHANALDPFAKTHFWMGRDGGRIFPLLKCLMEENRNPSIDTSEMSEAILRQIIVTMTRIYREDVPAAQALSRTATDTKAAIKPIIDDLFCYQYSNLTLPHLANMLNLGIRQTQRLLLESYGKTFTQKLTEARMAAAAQMLLNTQLSITEISERTGFSSIEYFSTTFRKMMKCSPREYRKSSPRTGAPKE